MASDGGVVGAVAGVASGVGSTAAVAVEATAVTTGSPVLFSFGSFGVSGALPASTHFSG
jgi:hypothetical protein